MTVKTFASPQAAQPCVAVVGMHRSGTSATAGLLVGLGLAGPKPDDLTPAPQSNERGLWESDTVHLCNVELLSALGGTTYVPPQPPPGWEHQGTLDPVRVRATSWFADTSDSGPVVLKDPRLCITLPFWRTAIPSLRAAVLVLRDPLDVAFSLLARDELPVVLGLALWDRYLRSAATTLQGLPTLVVEYDALLQDPEKWSEAVCQFFDEVGVPVDPSKARPASEFLDARLRHQGPDTGDYRALANEQRDVLGVLAQRVGTHAIWRSPELPPAPLWTDDVFRLRGEIEALWHENAMYRHELYWIHESRAFKMLSSVWRTTGGGPQPLPATVDTTRDRSAQ